MTGSRSFVYRARRIVEMVKLGTMTQAEIAERLDVSQRTIIRDMAFIRETLEIPLEFDRSTNVWRVTGQNTPEVI